MVQLQGCAVRIVERHSFSPYFEGMPNPYDQYDSEENLKAYEAEQRQRLLERRIRKTKREVMGLKTARDNATSDSAKAEFDLEYQRKAALLQKQNQAYNDYCEQNGLKKLRDRIDVARWDRKQAAAARGAAKTVATKANKYYNNGSTEANIAEYLQHAAEHRDMENHGLKFKAWTVETPKEAIVEPYSPKIVGEKKHAVDNRSVKVDRIDMSVEKAQEFVDSAKLVLYRPDVKTIKFLSNNGYAVINFDNELVTAVPQKWRKKYDKYVEGNNETPE
jgi:hypothetical protein